MASHDAKRNIRRQDEKKDADLINRHCRVMDAIEALLGNAEPPTMEFEHPTMRQDESTEPPQQNDVVDDQAPKQKLTDERSIHLLLPMLANHN